MSQDAATESMPFNWTLCDVPRELGMELMKQAVQENHCIELRYGKSWNLKLCLGIGWDAGRGINTIVRENVDGARLQRSHTSENAG